MEVYEPGTRVYCDPEEEIEGTIIRVFIETENFVRYRVAYWANGSRSTDNFRQEEIAPVDTYSTMKPHFIDVTDGEEADHD